MLRHTYLSRLADNPKVLAFALKAHAELYAAGLTDVLSLNAQEHAWYSQHNGGDVSGIIVFYDCDDEFCTQVDLIYVVQEKRRSGLCSELLSCMKHNKETGNRISIGTHASNEGMQSALERNGYTKKFIVYESE